MAYKPAPIQISYLGLPLTTGSDFIDYYIADSIVLPPEHSNHFTERLLLLKDCYIVNDYAQLQGDVVTHYSNEQKLTREVYLTNNNENINKKTIKYNKILYKYNKIFATFSNSQKITYEIYYVWMNILRSYQSSVLCFLNYISANNSLNNWISIANFNGIQTNRILLIEMKEWFNHISSKTTFDMIFDTISKNGHTTGLDGLWAGVPTMSVGNGQTMSTRAAESMATTLESKIGITYSLKEYEDFILSFLLKKKSNKYTNNQSKQSKQLKYNENINEIHLNNDKYIENNENNENLRLNKRQIREKCKNMLEFDDLLIECYENALNYIKFMKNDENLLIWRNYISKKRINSKLFNTKYYTNEFSQLIDLSYEIKQLNNLRNLKINKKYHIFLINNNKKNENIENIELKQINFELLNQKIVLKNYENANNITEIQLKHKIDEKNQLKQQKLYEKQTKINEKQQLLNKNERIKQQTQQTIDSNNMRELLLNNIKPRLISLNKTYYNELPNNIFDKSMKDKNDCIKLNIGGNKHVSGWYNVNSQVRKT